MTHSPKDCAHEWGGWTSETRVVESGVEHVLVRRCIACGAVDEMPHGREP